MKKETEFDDIIGAKRPKELSQKEYDEVREYRDKLYHERSHEDRIKDVLLGFRFSLRNYVENENTKEVILLGDFLNKLLDELNIKKGLFADYIDISPRNINKYFNGERKFTIEHALKIGRLFDVRAEILLEIQLKNELIQVKQSHQGEYDHYKLEDLLTA